MGINDSVSYDFERILVINYQFLPKPPLSLGKPQNKKSAIQMFVTQDIQTINLYIYSILNAMVCCRFLFNAWQ